ncbi:SIMPL domain-containing protein [Asticcacaulis machinosus]|uniref:SIMPL domain-containing protein n=1 Tax=Asticcacaulis machinosus TaxID=2984211 RepID=A0ABT5HI30_9CAUL|nr:SIMPL domain-containing protein [Asticcacaulis machinosus]MDC7675905.1 SIMPL domain-containing protein [Asticcacaulis machinosus]
MRTLILTASLIALAGTAVAQMAPAANAYPYDKAPWWMKESVITQTGFVRTEVEANRANFSAQFQTVGKTAEEAQNKAIAQTKALNEALKKLGADKVQISTSFTMRALYEQYKDKDGNRIENQRGDKIDAYQVNLGLTLQVRDMAVLERAYALVLAANPTSTAQIYFNLEPSNETKSWLYSEAVKDAARRAKSAAADAGAVLGKVKVIDPTGRACETDILARGAPESYDDTQAITVMGTRKQDRVTYDSPPAMMAAPAPASPVEALEAKAAQNPFIQAPPLRELTAKACVVYGLN